MQLKTDQETNDGGRRHTAQKQMMLCAVSCLLLGLMSCKQREQLPTIALITPLTTTEVWKAMHAGVYRVTAEAHYGRYWNAPTHEHDFDRQIELVQQELKRGVSGIVLAPVHGSALISVAAEAQRAGIPIVIVVNQLSTPLNPPVATITTDENASGRLAAQAINQLTHGRGTVAIVGIDAFNTSSLVRVESFSAELRQRYPDLKIVKKVYAHDSTPRLFAASPELGGNVTVSAIFSLSAGSTREVVAQLAQAGKMKRPVVVGCDQDAELYDDLRAGKIDVVIAEDTYRMGALAAEQVVAAIQTGRPPRSQTLMPVAITRANLDSAEMQQFLKPYAGFDR